MSSKRDAVEIVPSSKKPIAKEARELGNYYSTLGNWVKQGETNRESRTAWRATSVRNSLSCAG